MKIEEKKMCVLAPAKVNLFLRIVGRRADGYHLLDSLMVPVSLYDEIEIIIGDGPGRIVLTCDDPTIPCDETNLVHKAAQLICHTTGVQADLRFSLHKRIPAGAGLGGGSSDAAAVLKGVNTGLSLGLTEDTLRALAVQLGADVPFFILCHPARVSGIGEILEEVLSFPPRWLVIVVPPFGVPTPWAYRRFDEMDPAPQPSPQPSLLQKKGGNLFLINDLERAVIPEYPLIRQIKDRLLHLGAEGALMSGSGSAVFGIFSNFAQAEAAVPELAALGKPFVVETVPSGA